jgi:hypothetical protein
MIPAAAECYFIAKLEGEAASNLALQFSPGAALDIEQVIMSSDVFKTDIEGISFFDQTVTALKDFSGVSLEEEIEEINPLYLPCRMDAVDEVLDIDVKRDIYQFEGLDGNPFTIKLIEAGDESSRLEAVLRYRPFQLPGYMELSEAHQAVRIN